MWETAALLLAAVGGYTFNRGCDLTRVAVSREEGQGLFFRSVFWGYVFFQAACLCLFPFRVSPDPAASTSVWDFWTNPTDHDALSSLALIPELLLQSIAEFQSELLAPAALALAFGSLAWLPINAVANSVISLDRLVARQIDAHGTELEKMLFTALAEQRMLLITLESAQVYAGWIIRTPNLELKNDDPGAGAGMLCALSGFRESETQQVQFTTDYTWLHREGAEAHMGEVETFIPLGRVMTATWFDPKLFREFQLRGDLARPDGKDSDPEQGHGKVDVGSATSYRS